MNWKPIGDQILVKQQAKQEKTKNGIYTGRKKIIKNVFQHIGKIWR